MSGYKKLILAIIAITFVASAIFMYKPAEAQWSVIVMNDIFAMREAIYKKARGIIEKAENNVMTQVINTTLSTFMNKLAYDLANNLATGGPGQKPLMETESFTKSIQTAKDAALGEFVGQLSKSSFEELGFNLCDPSLEIKLSLTLSLIDSKAPPKPTAAACNWRTVQKEWAKFGDNFTADLIKLELDKKGKTKGLEDFFANGFSLEQTDLGVFAKLNEAARQDEWDNVEARKALTEKCKGYLDNTTPITEEIKTSCTAILQLQGITFDVIAKTESTNISESALKKEIGIIGQIMKTAGKIFASTFTSKLMNKWIKEGTCSLLGGGCTNWMKSDNSGLRPGLLAQLRGGADIGKSNGVAGIITSQQKIEPTILEAYNIMDDFAVCPEDVDFRKPDNCVVSSDFLQAVSSRTTLQDAIDKGMLKGDLPLINIEDSQRNTSQECYKDALCYNNLVKLRKANVIPTGWEMAALRSEVATPITLQQVINCFEDVAGKCSEAVDPATGHNLFYHLIDPYWILKIPPALCNAYVYSPILESPDTSNRQEYCADVKTCLREDGQGNCMAGEYGYCTKTENIWRFPGDECRDGDIYAGCLTFQNEAGSSSYLEQSLDYCTADQVGCQRYSQEQDNNGNWYLGPIATDDNDLFLNNASAACPADMAGCSEYIVMAADTKTNLVANGSFDNLDGDISSTFATGTPDGWFDEAGALTTAVEYDGSRIANSYSYGPGGHLLATRFEQKIVLLPNTTYNISVSAAQHPALPGNALARVSLLMCDENTCSSDSAITNLAAAVNTGIIEGKCIIPSPTAFDLRFIPGETMQRESCTFTTNQYTYGVLLNLLTNATADAIWFDDVKLEMVSSADKTASAYSAYGVGSTVYMGGSRFMCLAEEVGCQGYTPTNGDPMIPAVISQNDLCPNECVGYASFMEEPDKFDLIEDSSAIFQPFNFIPSTAQTCPATAVGCEEFTNIDAVADGGEGREYYSYLRQCVPLSLGADYITWEGTDLSGYQIRAWKALVSNIPATVGTPPCTNIIPGADDCNDADGSDIAVPRNIAACGPETPDLLDDSNINANCRQFFDASGNTFWRLQDRVIFATDDCHDYRRTLNPSITYRATTSLSTQCSVAQNGCRAYYGNTANNVRNIFSDDFERDTYAPWIKPLANLDLSSESLERNGHSLKVTSNNPGGGGIAVPIGAVQNKKQYKLSWWMKSSASLKSVSWRFDIPAYVAASGSISRQLNLNTDSSLLNISANNWQYYTITYDLILGDDELIDFDISKASLQFIFLKNDPNVDVFLDNIILKEVASNIYVIRNSWQTPVSCDTPYLGYHLGCQTYTDTNKNKYNLRSFENLCRVEAIGCMAVIDTHNSDYPFQKTYNHHCSDGVSVLRPICEALGGTWTTPEYSTLIVPADNIDYLVPDNTKYCPSTYKGCQALGAPDRTNPSYLPTVYKINDPDQYASTLCRSEALYCEAFNSDKGSYYFKDPRTETCTYQKNIMVGTLMVAGGWFKTANLKDTPPIGCTDNGDGTIDMTDFARGQSAALCPTDKNLCTAFYDPTDPTDPTSSSCNSVGTCSGCADVAECLAIENERECRELGGTYKAPDCQAYYYYNNNKIDKASCNGQVNKNNGCVLFKDASNWNGDHSKLVVNYDAKQSYALNLSQSTPVAPISCDKATDPTCNLDTNVLLKVNKDRQCSEWLACRTSTSVWDKANNRYKIVCTDVGTCNKFDNTNNVTKCAGWTNPVNEELTVANYQDRSTGVDGRIEFGDEEYLGYSIPGMKPVQLLTDVEKNSLGVETRGYAQIDSPYPSSISPDAGRLDRLQAYAGANICEVDQVDPITASPNGCEVNYVKVSYGSAGVIRYYPTNFPSPSGICSSGNTDTNIDCVDSGGFAQNYLCDTYNNDGTSRNDGTCDKKIKAETVANLTGICLEHDANAKVINDTGGTNYCNQWYPSDQFTGATSLYDNYREAGYYEPGGRDALFCSVPSNYITTIDRVYCIANSTGNPSDCNAVALVPAGSKINVTNLSGNSSVVNYSYLRQDIFNYVPAFGLSEDYPTNIGFANGLGLDRIEKTDLNSNSGYAASKFTAADFILAPNTRQDQCPVVTLDILNKIFVLPPAQNISVFYFDEDVDLNFKDSINGRVWIGDRLEIAVNNPTGTEGCYDTASGGNTGTEDIAANCDQCDLTSSKTWHSAHNGSASLGQPEHGFCNPLSYNYYLKTEKLGNCSSDCSSTIPKGHACLNSLPEYSAIVTPCTTAACKFKACAESASAVFWQRTCVSYGEINYGARVSSGGIRDVDYVSGCLANMFKRVPVNEDDPYSIYGIEVADSSITPTLIQQAIGNTTVLSGKFIVETVNSLGCLENNAIIPSCVPSKGLCDLMTCGYVWTVVGYCDARFKYTGSGSTCSGGTCYQQCSVIVQLDPEGDLSHVRTDIWWRNETGSGASGRENYMNGPAVLASWPDVSTWVSWYYKNLFIRNSNVNYSGVTDETVKFTHFGSALGFLGNDIVNVRVPVNASVFSPLSAVTFFNAGSPTGEPTAREMIDYSNYADWQFLFLFERVHRLIWDPINNFYTHYTTSLLGAAADDPLNGEKIFGPADFNQIMVNKYAGLEYNPVILKVCGNNVCSSATDPAIDGLTVNEKQSGNIEGSKSLFATLKFYYFAHPDHMPIQNIIVDWGDGSSVTSVPGKYKNNIPDCNSDLPMPGLLAPNKQGFGGTERACREGYKTFYHDYQYSVSGPFCDGGTSYGHLKPIVYNDSTDTTKGFAACYSPVVTVRDHWYPWLENLSLYKTDVAYDDWIVVTRD